MIHQHLFARLARNLILRTGPAACPNKHGARGLRRAVLALLVGALAPGACGAEALNLIPWPTSVEMGSGRLALSAQCRIVAMDPSLAPLAQVLTEEIAFMTGLRLTAVAGPAQAGDWVLQLDPARNKLRSDVPAIVCDDGKRDESHTVTVGDRAVVVGGSPHAVAQGTATLLQLLDDEGGRVSLPQVTIADAPQAVFRSVMIDVARQTHSLNTLKKVVVLCRFYKIGYLQLHFTDDQAFTFPSTAFPALTTPARHYTLEELRELEQFAAARGVAIVPEIEVPGHSGPMRQVKPFGGTPPGVINIGSETLYPALDTLVGEVCDIFKSTPYFHIGGDECWLEKLGESPEEKAYIKAHNVPDAGALYDHFIVRMNEIVRKHGKQTLVWEGFQNKGSENCVIPDNVIVFAWETMYQTPQSLLNNGYTLVNAAWRPLYIVGDESRDPESIYQWNQLLWKNHFRHAPSFIPIQLAPDTVLPDGSKIGQKVIGANMSVWEQKEDIEEIPFLRQRLPAMSERIWNPAAGRSLTDFRQRLVHLDAKVARLMAPIRFTFDGLTDPNARKPSHAESLHNRPLQITMAPVIAGTTVRYTLDGSAPTSTSPAAAEPLRCTTPETVLKAQVFDPSGKAVGRMLWETYQFKAITDQVAASGLVLRVDGDWRWPAVTANLFEKGTKLTVTLAAPGLSGGTLRYALNAPVTATSPAYQAGIVIDQNAELNAGYYDASHNLIGQPYRRKFEVLGNFERSLTTGKPVTTSRGAQETDRPDFVCDGFVDGMGFWAGPPCPGWLQVDLEQVCSVNKIQVVPYWDGDRYYQYYVEVSVDGKSWKKVIDQTTNTKAPQEKGLTDTFEATPVRYIRVTVTHNSSNPGVHLVELRAWGPDSAGK